MGGYDIYCAICGAITIQPVSNKALVPISEDRSEESNVYIYSVGLEARILDASQFSYGMKRLGWTCDTDIV